MYEKDKATKVFEVLAAKRIIFSLIYIYICQAFFIKKFFVL